ncbi:DUF1080 domain-containing protein [Mucilaginibacter limnophilus]|uniref:DUF1080 domain-containing protein n=1 Tax=Mucilaginibacter limnophilus TaxID=1932778 RepID=A0A437MKN1_9SPHI|nr:DUF1080 domain-containing protein [Mucilaginibacter limnophilus]RVT98179.1 DUF1080 domain-containing protein [Mucilaginibacter limnophilus]
MKKLLPGLVAILFTCTQTFAQTTNTLTAKEQKEGWVSLFDGKTTGGWHTYNKGVAGDAWTVADGVLQLNTGAEGRGDIITDKEYENYELALDWKIAEGGNSGIIFDVNEDPKYSYSFLTGIEMQILDNEKAEDNKLANHLAGSLYDLIPAGKAANPAGQWNSIKIRKDHGKLTFWLNGSKVVNVQMGSADWKALVEKSKFKSMPDWATYGKGHIALQDHGNAVYFRNIKLKQL